MMRKLLKSKLAAFIAMPIAFSAAASEPYSRVTDQPNGKITLEMCTRTFQHQHDDTARVHLVSAIHIADQDYYDAMQELLNQYTSVLYEGIKPAGFDPIDQSLDDQAKADATRDRLQLLVQISEQYRSTHGEFPQGFGDLANAKDKRIASIVNSIKADGWGNPISITQITNATPTDTTSVVSFISKGADGESGGEGLDADIIESSEPVNPNDAPQASPEGIQNQLANALRVKFQLDEMDMGNPEWVNADMDVNQLQQALSEYGEDSLALLDTLSGESFGAKIAGFVLNFVSRSPQLSSMMKLVMMDLLAIAEQTDLIAQQNDAMSKVIVDGRNDVVIEYLLKELESHPNRNDIAIFYGAGHMPGIEETLVDMGYEPVEDRWNEAMTVNPKDTGLSEMQIKLMRNMMKSSIQQQFAN